ncbi:hypothetical protein A2803_04500 [Candidatus Woesebacteria bacterium RIFCSPHIGHO2_01_FULL_44_21]|uniref:Uncharacterized protein n=1 Tax=Candidatus Woesebacteria bacterium RIFCSPHIGHO2_01_FULL_44_21 TaxID=1802503 RepID=A0A1F7YWK1_9BACT|nr:MAG: hypothetical protein A2803_04500 [Candidatus Woesebacteria bacterium RIFCSPHIGHO2_01_FULL_44_21]OGM71332.1 MAG: hypothetical protein A2897_00865 [Candidatus Woesebacteria bacterium RIFCSPLOWO2_01_FULL_44_24b]
MDHSVKRHKNIARFVAILGILPGAWFLLATRTEIGGKLEITCGYWMVALVILAIIWVMYAILTKVLMSDIGAAHDNAGSLMERRHYKIMFASTFIEAVFASLIFAVSLGGFLVTDLQCYLHSIM